MPDRVEQAIDAALALLEDEGEGAVTMRRIAERVGVRAPSLYKHLPDKAALEVALVERGLEGFAAALAATPDTLDGLARAYRTWALAHPHLYLLITTRPLPRDRLPEGLERRAAAPVLDRVPDPDRARALWAAAHGLVSLELAGRFPPDADLDAAWAALTDAFDR